MNDLQWEDIAEMFFSLSEKRQREFLIFLLSLKDKEMKPT